MPDYASELQGAKLTSPYTTNIGYGNELLPKRTSGPIASAISGSMENVPWETASKSTTLSTYLSEYPTEQKAYNTEYGEAQNNPNMFQALKQMGQVQEKYIGRAQQLRGSGREKTVLEATQTPMTGLMAAGAVSNPVALGLGLGGYNLMDRMFNLRRILPEDSAPAVKDIAEVTDFVIKGGVLGKVMGKYMKPPLATVDAGGKVSLDEPLQLGHRDTKLLPPPPWYKEGVQYGELPSDMQPGVIQGSAPRQPVALLEQLPDKWTSKEVVPSVVEQVVKPDKQWVTYKRLSQSGDIIQSGTVNIGDTLLEALKNREGVVITRIANEPPVRMSYKPKEDFALPEQPYKPLEREGIPKVKGGIQPGEGTQIVGKEEAGIVEDPTPPQITKRTLTPAEIVEQERIVREEWDNHQVEKEKIIKFHSGPDFEEAFKQLRSAYSTLGDTLRNFSTINPSEKVVDKVVDKWYGAINRGDLTSKWLMEDVRKAIPSQVRRELVGNVMEGTKPESLLAPSEVKVMTSLRTMYEDMFALAQKENVVKTHLDSYVTHIYKDAPQVVQAKLGKWRMGLAKSFRFGKQRLIPTMQEAKQLGLHPVEDISLILPEYSRQLFKTIANRNLIDTLNSTLDENGIPLAKSPSVARTISDLTDPGLTYSTWMKRYTNVRGFVKRAIMYNPAIHGWNMFSVAVNETNFNIGKAIGTIREGGKQWKGREQVVREMVDNGLNVTGNLGEELRGKLMHSPDPITHSIMNDIHTLKDRWSEWSDDVLWDGIVRNGQMGLYQLEKGKLMKQGLDAKSAGKTAAHLLNDFFGTLPSHWMSPLERGAGSMLLLARNWTYSNLRMLSGSLGKYADSRFLPNFLRHKGLSPEQMNAAQRVYVSHLIKGVGGLILYSNLIQIGTLTMKANRDKKDIGQAWRDGTIHFTWENPGGKKLDIDLGMRDAKGRDKYLVNPLFRYIRDYFGWTGDPARTAYNKMEPILKSSLEALMNYEPWRNKAVTEKEGIVGMMEKLAHIGKGVTPWRGIADPLTGVQDETGNVLSPVERLAPLVGTWTTSGLAYPSTSVRMLSHRDKYLFLHSLSPQERSVLNKQMGEGMIRGDMAQKLMEFRKSKHISDSEIDQRIDTLAQQGRYTEALEVITDGRRYSSRESMRRKMREWKEREQAQQ